MVVRYIRKGPNAYTTVGNPTIVNGVASNFSTSNYISVSTSNFPSTINSYEIGVKFTTGTLGSSAVALCGMASSYCGFYINGSKALIASAVNFSTMKRSANFTGPTLEDNTTYYAKWRWDSNGILFSFSLDGFFWEHENITSGNTNFTISDDVTFGATSSTAFNGSIDLNDTYIKINNELYCGEEIFIPKTQIDEAPRALLTADKKVLLRGEPAYELDTNSLKVGDGITAYSKLPYLVDNSGEWIKPDDWVDIRSGALDNSVYFLVAHSKPVLSEGTYTIANYQKFAVVAQVSTSANTYDVYVDGVKVATTAHNTTTTLDWGTLYTNGTILGGYDITHPSEMTSHIVRVTPTTSTDTLTRARVYNITGQTEQGTLWIHFQLQNEITLVNLAGTETTLRNYLLEAVTAKNNKIIYHVASSESNSGFYAAFCHCRALVQIPVLEAASTTYPSGTYMGFALVPAKKVVIKNNKGTENLAFLYNAKVQEFDIENGVLFRSGTGTSNTAASASNLKKLPTLSQTQDGPAFKATGWTSLEDTFLDLSSNTTFTTFLLYGTSTAKILGLKGLIFSPSAPFTGTSPQINISYTGLDRAALVRLFNSLPTVTDSQVCNITGTTGAADLTAADLAIATGKGWTVTR